MTKTNNSRNIHLSHLNFSDSLSDIKKKVNILSNGFTPNQKGIKVRKSSGYHPLAFSHNNVRRVIIPYLDFDVNVWILSLENHDLLIDTGPSYDLLKESLDHLSTTPSHVLITHDHPDHIGGEQGLSQAGIEAPSIDQLNAEKIITIETPGHCKKHYSYYHTDLGVCFCGDALFANSMGRPNYSPSQSLSSVKTLLSLPDETLLFPGHGPATSVKWEKEFNCFYTERESSIKY